MGPALRSRGAAGAAVVAVFAIAGAKKTKITMPKFQKALLTGKAAVSE
jgi:hypothetical protein